MARRTNVIQMALPAPLRPRSLSSDGEGRNAMLDALMQQGIGKPVQSVGEGVANMGQMALAGFFESKDKRDRQRGREELAAALAGDDDMLGTLLASGDSDARLVGFDLYKQRQAPPSYPASVQEYQYGQENPDFLDHQLRMRQAGGTNVNIGEDGARLPKPPADHSYAYNPDGTVVMEPQPETGYMRPVVVPFAGGKTDQERQAAETAGAGRTLRGENLGTIVVQDMEEAYRMVEEYGPDGFSTFMRSQQARVPGTAAYDLNELLVASEATISLQNLQELKETSGAGLGNVSDKQSKLLAQAYGSVNIAQNREQLLDAIARVRNIYLDVIYGRNRGPERLPFRGGPWNPLAGSEWVDDDGRTIPWDEVDRVLGPPDQGGAQQGQQLPPFDENGWPVIAETGESVPPDEVLRQAREQIANGRDREAVINRVIEMGLDPSGL